MLCKKKEELIVSPPTVTFRDLIIKTVQNTEKLLVCKGCVVNRTGFQYPFSFSMICYELTINP